MAWNKGLHLGSFNYLVKLVITIPNIIQGTTIFKELECKFQRPKAKTSLIIKAVPT